MIVKTGKEPNTCLINIENNTRDLPCNNFWYNDNVFNLVDIDDQWIMVCGEFIHLYNFNAKIRKINSFANVFIKETSLNDPGLYRCRIQSCTDEEIENNIQEHPFYRVGVVIQFLCGDDVEFFNEFGTPTSYDTLAPYEPTGGHPIIDTNWVLMIVPFVFVLVLATFIFDLIKQKYMINI